jgi:hypothetical protein
MPPRITAYILAALQSSTKSRGRDVTLPVSELTTYFENSFDIQISASEMDKAVLLGTRTGFMNLLEDPLTRTRVKIYSSKEVLKVQLATEESIIQGIRLSDTEEDKADLGVIENYLEAGDEWLDEALENIRGISSDHAKHI